MITQQRTWTADTGWLDPVPQDFPANPQLVFVLGGRAQLENDSLYSDVTSFYPDAHILWCSTAGEIAGTRVNDDSLVVTALSFEKTTLSFTQTTIADPSESEQKGSELAQQIEKADLKHVMVFSDGLKVNGTSLVKGLTQHLPEDVSITGGLVGDGSAFEKTLVSLDAVPAEGNIVLVGFHGSALHVGYGSLGGWDTFGPERVVTRSEGNVLYELDEKPALSLYKEYLAEKAAELPSSGLLFPLRVRIPGEDNIDVVRTILAVDEEEQSVTFAGDIPQGTQAQLMRANFDRLIDGASNAADMSLESFGEAKPDFAMLISCVGRKLVLQERIEEEVEGVQRVIGEQATITGFYSYGEICPTAPTEKQCQLHNQTMTITTFREE